LRTEGEISVRAPEDGAITNSRNTEGGNTVTLYGSSGAKYLFMHLSSFMCASGATVKKGDVIAITGNTGSHTTGEHLHFAYIPTTGSPYKYGYADPYGKIFYSFNPLEQPTPPAEYKEYNGKDGISTSTAKGTSGTGGSIAGEEDYYYPKGTGKSDSTGGNLVLNSNSINLTSDFISEKNKASYENVMRIYEYPSIRPTITVDGISLQDMSPHGNDGGSYSSNLNDMKNTVGISYPLIKMKGHIFNHNEIVKFTIDYSSFIPSINGVFIITKDTNITVNMPLEGDVMNVELRSRNSILKSIRQDFIITSVNVIGNGAGIYGKMMMVRGRLQVEGLTSYSVEIPGFNGTSKEVIMNSAVNLGLGFAFNDFDNTSDVQTWSSGEKTMEEFIIDTTNRAWKNPQSFFKSWIDPYYNLTLINVNYT
ncbi:MAG: M23 family metallopeptidase, partial [Spirochaetia bacterium]|nr:M23 family metallopeptidase [Spirochaetia bacterium]